MVVTTEQIALPGLPLDTRPPVRGMDAYMDAVFRERLARDGFAATAKDAPDIYADAVRERMRGRAA